MHSHCKYLHKSVNTNTTELTLLAGEASKGNTCTIQVYGMGFPIWQIGFNRMGDNYFVGNMYRLVGNVREVIQKGDQIFLKFSNGESSSM
ncbi:MAG: hypothetical protein FWC10_07705 [Lentimicrobiaceae bacterium]|nr:hypothetical protein [Lentimicrobiaceae bacterium]